MEGSIMSKWYRKTLTKAALLIAGVLSGASFLTSLAVVTTLAGTVNPAEIMRIINEPYEESADFNMVVESSISDVFQQFRLKQFFEMDGAYNPDKVVDIGEGSRDLNGNGGKAYGIGYTLDELIDWGKDFYTGENDLYNDNEVIVCQKPGGEYYYYYLEEFFALFDSGEFHMVFDDEPADQNQESYLRELENGSFTSSGEARDMTIYDADGVTVYTDCWNFGESLREKYAPQGAENLLQIINGSPWLNGRLSSVYNALEMTLATIYEDYESYQSGWEYLAEGNTNLTYLYIDTMAKKVETNKSTFGDYLEAEANLSKMKSGDNVKYVFVYPKLKDFETNLNLSPTGEWQMVKGQETSRRAENIFAVAIDTTYPIKDLIYEGKVAYEKNLPLLRTSMVCLVIGASVLIVSAVWLALTAGRCPEDEEVHLTAFDHWKTEAAALTVTGVWVIATMYVLGSGYLAGNWRELQNAGVYYYNYYGGISQMYSAVFSIALGFSDVAKVFLYSVFTFLCFFGGYISLFRRIKAKTMWKGSLTYAVISFGKRVIRARSSTMKTILLSAGFLFIHWAVILVRTVPFAFVTLLVDVVAVWFVLNRAIAKTKIIKGIEEIASGNLEYRIGLDGLRGGDRELAEKVNGIGSGLNMAVDEAMRNERLKTDLITNVSHDIKTPLTSIINYVDILKRSDIADEKIRGYLDILEAKAQRLKTLTEDVVEASKVSSGNISLEYMNVDMRELVKQTEGELAERFAARNLSVVLNMPQEAAVIRVDGRRMWRVLENVFGNAAKYAMPGTRVYADLTVTEDKVRFSLKNVSEQQLNFSADELTERFIRGDISRSTEGSGLGLSIAKSLTTMQGGEFELYLDGDLFKVDITFPREKFFIDFS